MFFEQYGLRGLASAPGSLLAVRQVAALGGPAATLAVVPLIIVVLLFPDGRLPSRRWRPVLWGAIEVAVVGGAGTLLQRGTVVSGSLTNALQAAHVAYPNPLGVFPRQGWYGVVLAVTAVIALVTALLAVASVVARRRRAAAELRQQLAWLAYVGVLFLAALAAFLADGIRTRGAGGPLLTFLFILAAGIALLGVPAACAVAVLKYRLYDLDVVVRKTVVAGLVAGTFTVIYALVVLGAGALAGRPGNGLLTFTAAAIAAVLLQPVRARAGLLADHLVYGRRATPYEVLSEFSERMAGRPRPRTCCPGWRGCWRRRPAPSRHRSGCAQPGPSGWQRRGWQWTVRLPGQLARSQSRMTAGPVSSPWSIRASGWARCGSLRRYASR